MFSRATTLSGLQTKGPWHYLQEMGSIYLKLMRKAFGTDVTSLISADVHVVKLVALSWTSMILDKELFFIRKPIKEIRVAPNGKVVAIVTDIDEAFDRFRIAVVSLATNDLQVVTEAGSEYPDWSADSQNLLYFQKMWASSKESEDELPSFGALSKTRVCDDAGHLLRDKQPSEQLAVVAYSSVNRVCDTADGRIFFSCPVLKLPAARPQHSYTQGLFALDPSRFYATIPLIDQSDSNLVCQAFESSRDGKTVAIPEKNGTTHLLSVLTGKIEEIESGPPWGRLIVFPAFRSNNELTYVRQLGDSTKTSTAKLVLWDIEAGDGRDLSANWPALLKSQWLYK